MAAIPLVMTLGAIAVEPFSAAAIQHRDGLVEFSYPLRLTDSYPSRSWAGEADPTYYFTFDFPATAVESLGQVVVSLDEGEDAAFGYRLEATQAFINTPEGQVPLSLGPVQEDPETHALTVQFSSPVPPGSPITLVLRPYYNPRSGGVYLFGLRAYPVGTKARPTFMGYARFSFYERDRLWP
ncbi:MAG: DUF2808 domain-containing protein [Nodosilinea sp. LVE1205-7]